MPVRRLYALIVSKPPDFDAGPACATPARYTLNHQALVAAATYVSDRPGRRPHQLLLALTRRPTPLIHDTLTRHDPTGAWSPAFRVLTRDFYLAF